MDRLRFNAKTVPFRRAGLTWETLDAQVIVGAEELPPARLLQLLQEPNLVVAFDDFLHDEHWQPMDPDYRADVIANLVELQPAVPVSVGALTEDQGGALLSRFGHLYQDMLELQQDVVRFAASGVLPSVLVELEAGFQALSGSYMDRIAAASSATDAAFDAARRQLDPSGGSEASAPAQGAATADVQPGSGGSEAPPAEGAASGLAAAPDDSATAIGAGRAKIPDLEGSDPPAREGAILVDMPDRLFSRDSMRGF